MSGDLSETGSLTPSFWPSPNPNRTWLKRTTASAPITPAVKQIATSCAIVMTEDSFRRSPERPGLKPRFRGLGHLPGISNDVEIPFDKRFNNSRADLFRCLGHDSYLTCAY